MVRKIGVLLATLWIVAIGRAQDHVTVEFQGGVAMPSGVTAVAFSPNGNLIAAGCNDHVIIWDHAGQQLSDYPVVDEEDKTAPNDNPLTPAPQYHISIRQLRYSRDGKLLAAACQDSAARVWDTTTGKLLWQLQELKGGAFTVSFSPDGKWLATGGGERVVKIWDMATGKSVHTLSGHQYDIRALYFVDDNTVKSAAVGSPQGDAPRTELRVWDIQKEVCSSVNVAGPQPDGCLYDPSGYNFFAPCTSSFNYFARVFDAGTGSLSSSSDAIAEAIAVSQNDQVLVGVNTYHSGRRGALKVEVSVYLHRPDGFTRKTYVTRASVFGTGKASAALSPQGNTIAVGLPGGELQVYSFTIF